jgi:hypothetical protein
VAGAVVGDAVADNDTGDPPDDAMASRPTTSAVATEVSTTTSRRRRRDLDRYSVPVADVLLPDVDWLFPFSYMAASCVVSCR